MFLLVRGKLTWFGAVVAAAGLGWRAATRAHLPRDLMKEAAPVAAVSNEVAAVALVISALALGAQSSALR